jgi:two-component system sensor histidine kinase TctE
MVKRNQLAREILLSVVVPQALIILVAVTVVWLGVVHGLKPLEGLRRTLAARSTRDWSPIVADGVPGEVRPLLHAINELVARLDAALTAQNRFISDAAHQLKTPMTVLKTQLELALREEDPVRGRDALAAARTGAERMSRVVSQLLSLARNEPEASHAPRLASLDINALAFEAATSWAPVALKKHVDLGFEGTQMPVMVRGDAARLREMLDNLVDNAVRYGRDGGRVTVRVAGGTAPMVQVEDDGPPIPLDERGRIFERFHRSLGTSQEGSGLGLAIAREIARIHDAAIELVDGPGGGKAFCITFPPSIVVK